MADKKSEAAGAAPVLTIHDRPNSYIGKSVPRPNAKRLLHGRGTFTDDVRLPRMLHAAYLRSPFAHAEIVSIDTGQAEAAPGVTAVFTGADVAEICTPYVGVLTHLQGMRSPPQYPLAVGRARWQGEPVAVVAAATRAQAEDALELIRVEYSELPAVTDMEAALDADAEVIHPEYENNLCWERVVDEGDVETALANSAAVVEAEFIFGRHTGVTLEPRSIIADYDQSEEKLTVHHSTQGPHMIQAIIAKHFGLEEHNVRIICKDVGGAFGIKVHTYGDELGTVALSMLLKRPVKFIADRLESFASDIHARDHVIKGRMGVDEDGKITAIDYDDITGIGPFSMYPRSSGIEINQVLNLTAGWYDIENYRARGRVVFLNKAMMCQYRAVGHPIAMALGEGLAELAAAEIGIDPLEFRRRNLIPDDAYPTKSVTGMPFEKLSHHAVLEKLAVMMDYDAVRAEQAELSEAGVHRGIGFSSMIEVTTPSAMFYGVGGAPISAQDGATIRLDAKGNVFCATSVTEQGQGAEAIINQIAATAIGVTPDRVRVITGDTENTPYGGGTWASRGTGIAGEATAQAGHALRRQILEVAGKMLQADPASLDIRDNQVVDAADGAERLDLAEIGRVVYYRADTLPPDFQAELSATRHFVPKAFPFAFTNGMHASYVEVDVNTGMVTPLKHWVVEDCGKIINPMLVDEQVRGGVVQGIGGALYEECLYSPEGQLTNGNMADYLVPMAGEMPDIEVGHVESPMAESEIGAKGVGEAGTGGAPAAIMNAVNDAIRPLDARITQHPMTPERVLRALGKL
ncbi:MAG: xanthine dehydrogenase family protein molybdopterin-binding subunit [Rhodospirillales bacterium]|jgi:carbon-monoxide dehydrogenase large subunit|nr:carbon monoxide dehydrogenase [Rhodospirillaceae bacterium]MDP6428634.1 xanthine dehydrogenase family protein molybdopterin-binding subunit [Rhodospirillales bacterium]MDP6645047.1 xanthine dehydrogenase family protein molybdopterin-binding subunit [Rhodospirillales bacterium]MDP6842257.1 xanthine dehydrogenase family protein molybdopterin-binding subunit [Rhodospirillales bacterium]